MIVHVCDRCGMIGPTSKLTWLADWEFDLCYECGGVIESAVINPPESMRTDERARNLGIDDV